MLRSAKRSFGYAHRCSCGIGSPDVRSEIKRKDLYRWIKHDTSLSAHGSKPKHKRIAKSRNFRWAWWKSYDAIASPKIREPQHWFSDTASNSCGWAAINVRIADRRGSSSALVSRPRFCPRRQVRREVAHTNHVLPASTVLRINYHKDRSQITLAA